jgi:hypothetical protein
MKNKIYSLLTKPFSVILVLLIATLLSLADRNFGYFFGLGVVIFMAWKNKWNWAIFGFGKKINRKTVGKSLLLTIPLFIGLSIIEPFLQNYFGAFNLSSVDDIRDDVVNYAILMVIMWVFAAYGEELLFRGYYMQGFAKLFGNTNASWLFSALLISVYFGISHAYQGIAGIIAVTLGGFYFSTVYYTNRDNLAIGALVHGFYDTIGLTLIYLNKDGVFSDWIYNVIVS